MRGIYIISDIAHFCKFLAEITNFYLVLRLFIAMFGIIVMRSRVLSRPEARNLKVCASERQFFAVSFNFGF